MSFKCLRRRRPTSLAPVASEIAVVSLDFVSFRERVCVCVCVRWYSCVRVCVFKFGALRGSADGGAPTGADGRRTLIGRFALTR